MNINFIGANNKSYSLDVGINFTDKNIQKDFIKFMNNSKIDDLGKNIETFLNKYKKHSQYNAILDKVKNWSNEIQNASTQAAKDKKDYWTADRTKLFNTLVVWKVNFFKSAGTSAATEKPTEEKAKQTSKPKSKSVEAKPSKPAPKPEEEVKQTHKSTDSKPAEHSEVNKPVEQPEVSFNTLTVNYDSSMATYKQLETGYYANNIGIDSLNGWLRPAKYLYDNITKTTEYKNNDRDIKQKASDLYSAISNVEKVWIPALERIKHNL